ncbi:uncharacterized protein LOC128126304 [Lactuca sativa]|uniref:Uncharacterized protein n=1 Tax=Lactuca saligna TaxID=75948 RepID=A0AA35Z6M7_LACSI|nr:uncharacterized protein LOC128126304 [Lactuca sativa]CAI9286427.1 unnamed protein product [Lactuca saligna]
MKATPSQQSLLDSDGQCNDDQSQCQLRRDGQGESQDSILVYQAGNSVKTMAHGAGDVASGAARGAMGFAQGAAMGATHLAQGAASAVSNTFHNPRNHNLHTRLPTENPQNPRY